MNLPPLPPQPLSGQVSLDGRFLELSWERRRDHAPSGWYEVACRTLEEDRLGAWKVIARPAETTFSWALEGDGTWLFRVRFQDPSGRWSPSSNLVGMSAEEPVTAVSGPAAALPGSFRLEQNVPNPFNATTTIRYTLAQAQPVELWLFNLAGQRVRRLAGGMQPAGEHLATWDGRDEAGRPAATGIYFYRLEGTQTATRKLLLLR